jgi:hypothetical protein
MFISHKFKLIFVHIPKNWGTSVALSFQEHDEDIIFTGDPDHNFVVDRTHMLPQYYFLYPEISKAVNDGYTIFSVIRDPESRFFSSLEYARTYMAGGAYNFAESYMEKIRNRVYITECRFIHGSPQYEFIYDGNRKVSHVDFLCNKNLFDIMSDYFSIKLNNLHKNPSEKENKEKIEIKFETYKDIYKKDFEIYNKLKQKWNQ